MPTLRNRLLSSTGVGKATALESSGRLALHRMIQFQLLLVLLLAKALAKEDPEPIFRTVGGELEMGYCFGVDYITLYKLSEKGKQLLGNSSNAAFTPPEAYVGRVSPTNQLHELLGMQVVNLKLSDSGVYLRECWRDNELVNYHKYYLYVCDGKTRSQEIFLESDGGAKLVCNVSNSTQNNATIKWFKEEYAGYKTSLFLDTKRSQEPLQEEMEGVLQVRDKGSSLHISEAGLMGNYHFFCLVMEGEQCKSFQNIHLPNSDHEVQSVFHGIGEMAVLSCSPERLKQRQVYWKTPLGTVNSTNKNKDSTGSDMYISRNEETGDNSLVIPSITLIHSGEYNCFPYMTEYFITVCLELKTNEMEGHTGSKVTLDCESITNESINIQWYRRTKLEGNVLIYDSGDPSPNTSANIHVSDTTLTITELTEEDSGPYWCVVLLDAEYDDSFPEDEDENDDETDDDYYLMAGEENTDNCVLKQVTLLNVLSKDRLTFSTKTPRRNAPEVTLDSTPKSDSVSGTLMYAVIGVIGLVVLILVIVVGVVVKLRARRRATDQSRAESSAQRKETPVSEPLLTLKALP